MYFEIKSFKDHLKEIGRSWILKKSEKRLDMEIKKRLCAECHTEMEPRLISMFYEEKTTILSIEVVGIPANVCPKCNFRLIPAGVARYIDTIVDPLFESSRQQKDKLLLMPHITVWFSSQPEMAEVV